MQFLKRLFNFYIKSSFHLGICLICLYVVSINKLEININYVLIIFLFCSTFFTYNFIKYRKKILKKLSNQNLTLNLIKYLSFFCLLILINTLFYLNFDTILFSVFLFVLCLLYVYPFAGLKSNFRNFSKVKLFFVAICWSGSVVVLPILEIGNSFSLRHILFFLQIFILVIIYTIPFEIRDLKNDSFDLQTIPQILGVKNSKIFCYALIILFIFISYIISTSFNDFFADLVLSVVLTIIIILTKEEQSKYFSSFWVEALPIYWLVVYYLMN